MKRGPVVVALASLGLGACTFIDPLDDLSRGLPVGPFSFVQGAFTAPQASSGLVDVSFHTPQRGGDTNVVVIGWNDTLRSIASVTDSNGNRYVEGIPVAQAGATSQVIYYATLVAPGESSVTVTFDAPAAQPDIRVLEYATGGREAAIVAWASATGMSAMAAAGPVARSDAHELVLAAATTHGLFTGPGSGFTVRSLTTPDGDIVEDAIPDATGTVVAEATLSLPGEWVMQVVVLR
jgi:hypothetical protein